MNGLGDVLRGLGSVLNPAVAQDVSQEDARRQQMEQQIGLLGLQQKIQQASPEYQAKMQALQQEQAFRSDIEKLGPNPDPEQLATLAVKHGKPEIAASLFRSQEDRKARLQTAADSLELRKLQAEQNHEMVMGRLTDQQQRTAEMARHNAAVEALTQQGNSIKKQLADFNAPAGGGSDAIENTAKMIAEGRIPPLSGFAMKSAFGQRVMSRVAEINPDYDSKVVSAQRNAETAFATGKQGNTVRSFNVALAHLDTLEGLADALHNGNTPIINKIGNEFARQTGGAAPVTFDAAKKIVGNEIVKAIVGAGGGVSDREEAAKTVANANSPAQLKSVISTYKELMKGQLGGLRQQYETSTGKKDFDKFLSAAGKGVAHGTGAEPPPPPGFKID
jgi:hypothetical protein